MSAHTPGPWFNDHNTEIRAGEYRSICGMRWPFDDPEKMANARLITAAPELLEACMVALAAIKSEYPFEHGNPTIGRAWGTLENAIEKATSNI